jgi:hypothetical protein
MLTFRPSVDGMYGLQRLWRREMGLGHVLTHQSIQRVSTLVSCECDWFLRGSGLESLVLTMLSYVLGHEGQ